MIRVTPQPNINKNKSKDYEAIAWVLIYISFVISIIAFLAFIINRPYFIKGVPIDGATHGQFGDFIGGIIGTILALVAAFLLKATLTEQRNSAHEQQISFRRQQEESRFFELLKLHRDNINELKLGKRNGRNVFIHILNEYQVNLEDVRKWYDYNNSSKVFEEWEFTTINIAYLLTFFGLNESSKFYRDKKINELLIGENLAKKKSVKFKLKLLYVLNDYDDSEDVNEDLVKIPNYVGHQFRLGHYFRHLFQTVTFINNLPNNIFSYKTKYGYIKTLRAQLSTHEQALLLINSITDLGAHWERHHEIIDENSKLITKYNLLKNIPFGFIKSINADTYYPNIHYEFDTERPSKRDFLEKLYK